MGNVIVWYTGRMIRFVGVTLVGIAIVVLFLSGQTSAVKLETISSLRETTSKVKAPKLAQPEWLKKQIAAGEGGRTTCKPVDTNIV